MSVRNVIFQGLFSQYLIPLLNEISRGKPTEEELAAMEDFISFVISVKGIKLEDFPYMPCYDMSRPGPVSDKYDEEVFVRFVSKMKPFFMSFAQMCGGDDDITIQRQRAMVVDGIFKNIISRIRGCKGPAGAKIIFDQTAFLSGANCHPLQMWQTSGATLLECRCDYGDGAATVLVGLRVDRSSVHIFPQASLILSGIAQVASSPVLFQDDSRDTVAVMIEMDNRCAALAWNPCSGRWVNMYDLAYINSTTLDKDAWVHLSEAMTSSSAGRRFDYISKLENQHKGSAWGRAANCLRLTNTIGATDIRLLPCIDGRSCGPDGKITILGRNAHWQESLCSIFAANGRVWAISSKPPIPYS